MAQDVSGSLLVPGCVALMWADADVAATAAPPGEESTSTNAASTNATRTASVSAPIRRRNRCFAAARPLGRLETPAAVRFVAAEPLLSAVELKPEWLSRPGAAGPMIDWVMGGGESGPKARPIQVDWVRALRDQCARTGTPFYWNDWGAETPDGQTAKDVTPDSAHRCVDGMLHEAFPSRA